MRGRQKNNEINQKSSCLAWAKANLENKLLAHIGQRQTEKTNHLLTSGKCKIEKEIACPMQAKAN